MESLNKKFGKFLQDWRSYSGFSLNRLIFRSGIERPREALQQIETEKISVNTAEIASYVNEKQIHSKEVFDKLYNPIEAMEIIIRKKKEVEGKKQDDIDTEFTNLQKEALKIFDEKDLKTKKIGFSPEEMDLLEYYWDQGIQSKLLNIDATLERDKFSDEQMQILKDKKKNLSDQIGDDVKSNEHFTNIDDSIKRIKKGLDESAMLNQNYTPLTEVEYQEEYRKIYAEIQQIQNDHPNRPGLASLINNYFDLEVALNPVLQIPEGMKSYLKIERDKLNKMRVHTSLKLTALKSKTLKIATVEEQIHQMKDPSIGKKSVDFMGDTIKGVKDFVGNIYNAEIPSALKLGIFGIGTYFVAKFLMNHKKEVGYGALAVIIGEAASLGLERKELFTQMLPELFRGVSLKSAERLRGVDEFEKIVDKYVKNKDKNHRIKNNFANFLVFSRESKMNALDYLNAWKNKDKTGGLVDIDTPLMTKKELTELLDFFFTYVYQPSVIERDCGNEDLNLQEIDFEMLFANWLTQIPDYKKKMKEFEEKGFVEKIEDWFIKTSQERRIELYHTPLSIKDQKNVKRLLEEEGVANGTATGWIGRLKEWGKSALKSSVPFLGVYAASGGLDYVLPEAWFEKWKVDKFDLINEVEIIHDHIDQGSVKYVKQKLPLYQEQFIKNLNVTGSEKMSDSVVIEKDGQNQDRGYYITSTAEVSEMNKLSDAAELCIFIDEAVAKAKKQAIDGLKAQGIDLKEDQLQKMRLLDAVIFSQPKPQVRVFARIPAGKEYLDLVQGKSPQSTDDMRSEAANGRNEVVDIAKDELLKLPNDFAKTYQRLELLALFPVEIKYLNDILEYILKSEKYLNLKVSPPYNSKEEVEKMILDIPFEKTDQIVRETENYMKARGKAGYGIVNIFNPTEIATFDQNVREFKRIEESIVNRSIQEVIYKDFPSDMQDKAEKHFREVIVPPLRAQYKIALLSYQNQKLFQPRSELYDLIPSHQLHKIFIKVRDITDSKWTGKRIEVKGNLSFDDIMSRYKNELKLKLEEYRRSVGIS